MLAALVLLATPSCPTPLRVDPGVSQDQSAGEDPLELAQRAAIAHEDGRLAEAIRLYEDICRLDPGDHLQMLNLACAHSRRGEVDRAIEWLQRAAEAGSTLYEMATIDPELEAARADPRSAAPLEQLRRNQEADRADRRSSASALRDELEVAQRAAGGSPIVWQDGHVGTAQRVVFSPDGGRLLTTGDDRTVRLWDTRLGELLATIELQGSSNPELAFGADGERLLVFDPSLSRASLWDGRSGERIADLSADGRCDWAARFLPGGERILTADSEGVVRAWDALSGARLPSPELHAAAGELLEPDDSGDLLLTLGIYERSPRLWDLTSGRLLDRWSDERGLMPSSPELVGPRPLLLGKGARLLIVRPDARENESRVFRAHRSLVAWYSASPDGARAVSIDGEGRALLWSPLSTEIVAEIEAPPNGISSVTWSPDGRRFVTLGTRGRLDLLVGPGHLWDAENGERLGELTATTPLRYVRFSPHGQLLLTVGGPHAQHLWLSDGSTGERAALLGQSWGSAQDAAFAPNGDRIAVANWEGSITLWDTRTMERIRDLSSHAVRQRLLAVAPDGRTVATGGDGARTGVAFRHTVHLWDLASGTARAAVEPVSGGATAAAFAPRGARLVFGPRDSTEGGTRVVDLGREGAAQRGLVRHVNTIVHVAISPEGDRILTTCMDGGARLFDAEAGDQIAGVDGLAVYNEFNTCGAVFDARADRFAAALEGGRVGLFDGWNGRALATMEGHGGRVLALAFGPRGERLASAGTDGGARLWDPRTAAPIAALEGHEGWVWDVAFDPRGERLATAGADGTVRVWSAADGRALHVLAGHARAVRRLAFAADGRRLLSVSMDRTARVWDADAGRLHTTLVGHVGLCQRGDFALAGRRVVTQGSDGTTRVWDADSGAQLATFVDYAEGGWLAFDRRGYYADGGRAAEWAGIRVGGRSLPLSSYAAVLRDPARVAAALSGEENPAPFLPSAPELRIVAPHDAVVPGAAFRLELLLEDRYGIQDVSVAQDGAPLPVEVVERGLALDDGRRSGRLVVPLAIPAGRSETRLSVRARNVRGILSEERALHVRHVPTGHDLYVLAIAVQDYAQDDLDLRYPAADVAALTDRFQREQGRHFAQVHVERLLDGEVGGGALRRLREEFLLRAGPEDTIVVFAAGHGVRSASGEYYFLTTDATPREPYAGIERSLLESMVTWERLHARRRVLLIDTCHSGEAYGAGQRGQPVDIYDQEEVDSALGSGLYILAASSERGFAQELEGNGLFTRALVEGLDGAADERGDRDGLVDVEELKEYAVWSVHERSAGRQRPTMPRVEGGQAFPLARAR